MPSRAIAVFVKTPGLSQVKTRLAEGVGTQAALEFYDLALVCVEALCNELEDTAFFWAVAEKAGLTYSNWLASGWDRIWTGEGALGKRQHSIYTTLLQEYDHVMLLGADCPQLCSADLEAGFAALKEHDFALGTAEDGGYTFLAGQKDMPLDSWEAVPYSQPITRSVLCAQLPGTYTQLPAHSDVDRFEDLTKMLQQMPETPNMAQQKLITWTQDLLRNAA